MPYDDPDSQGHLVKLDDSTFVERDVLNIIQKIYEYDPNLKVQFLNKAAELGDAPYRIIEKCKDEEWRVIFYAWQLDERVLDQLRMADTHTVSVLAALDANNDAVRAREGRRFRENMDIAKDIVAHVVKSPKGRYSFIDNGRKVFIDDDPKPSWHSEQLDD